jgi:oxygen-independent coproporphyrinogen-3 oxidase
MWRNNPPDENIWKNSVRRAFNESNDSGISLYIHLPFCEELCTYCACNKRITKNHNVEEQYITDLLTEWDLYLNIFGEKPTIREIHLGGGTPTFFHPNNLARLVTGILSKSTKSPDAEFSFEGHPNNTTREHLSTLYNLGFRRVSFGIQDLNEEVQRAINRIQPFENTVRVTQWAREIGYESVNFDIVYGLPFQHSKNLIKTLQSSLQLVPDRIAFYSYAHVPWTSAGQRAYDTSDLPPEIEKVNMYLMGRQIFRDRGYVDIGMDHFALPGDSLVQAMKNDGLHRNFMGYTVSPGDLLIGLGCSAISDSKYAYAQNEKHVEKYQERIAAGELPLIKGHVMSEDDMVIRDTILEIACNRSFQWTEMDLNKMNALRDLEHDGIISINKQSFDLTEKGIIFLRNVCAVFDEHLEESRGHNQYSQAI